MNFPDYYSFKFVTKTHTKKQLIEVLNQGKIQEKLSKNGNYTSVTYRMLCRSSDDVVAVYKEVSKIEGIVTL